MRILGLDPGSLHTGFGVLEGAHGRWRALAQGRISPPRGRPLPDRLAIIATELEQTVAEWKPDLVAIESAFHGASSRSLIVLAEARGALLVTIARAGLAVVEYAPAEVKQAVTGNGRAEKSQVARMVALQLGVREPLAADAADALAVALCCGARYRAPVPRDPEEALAKSFATACNSLKRKAL